MPIAHHVSDLEIFQNNKIVFRNQAVRQLVQKILSLPGNLQVVPLEEPDCLSAVGSPLFLPGYGPLQDAEFPLPGPIPFRVIGDGAGRVSGEVFDTDINTYRFARGRKRFGPDLTGEAGVPAVGLADDPDGRWLGRHLTVPSDGYPANTGNLQASSVNLVAIAVFLQTDAVEAVFSFETGIAWLLA